MPADQPAGGVRADITTFRHKRGKGNADTISMVILGEPANLGEEARQEADVSEDQPGKGDALHGPARRREGRHLI